MPKLTIAIVDFATPLERKGHLGGSGMFADPEIGKILHQTFQDQQEAADVGYRSEVTISGNVQDPTSDYTFVLKGRIDGIYETETAPIIEEIKSTSHVHSLLQQLQNDPEHPYILQTQLYGYLYHRCHDSCPELRLRLIPLTAAEPVVFPVAFDLPAITQWVEAKAAKLAEGEEHKKARRKRRKDLAPKLTFPFADTRKHQDSLMATVTDVCTAGQQALLAAPTGIGKTISMLYPAVRDSLRRGAQTIFVAPKNAQFHGALAAVQAMAKEAPGLRVFVQTARHKSCLNDEVNCDKDACHFAHSYYDRLAEHQVTQKIQRQLVMDEAYFRKLGKQHQLCPYALTTDAIAEADVIIGDYNHVFAPMARFGETIQQAAAKPNLLVDECHNLYQRAMEYRSLKVSRRSIDELAMALPFGEHEDFRALRQHIVAWLGSLTGTPDGKELAAPDGEALDNINKALDKALLSYLKGLVGVPLADPFVVFYQHWKSFLTVANEVDDHTRLIGTTKGTSLEISTECLNPSEPLRQTLGSFHSAIGFSATLKPFRFYQELSGWDDDAVLAEFPSPFPPENRLLQIIPQVKTHLAARKAQQPKIAEAIVRIASVQPGQYLAFFPSYGFMLDTYALLAESPLTLLQHRPGMQMAELQELMTTFVDSPGTTLLTSVQGGSLAEGVDLPIANIQGVFIIGPALPVYDPVRRRLQNYYHNKFGQGFDYAFTFPAMAKSIQAAGRLIRNENKRGVIFLLGDRFLQPSYSQALPRDWYQNNPEELAVRQQLLATVAAFWQGDHGI